MGSGSHLVRNPLINVFEEKRGDERCHEEDERNERNIFDVLIVLRLHEIVEPDGNVDCANDEKETRKRVQKGDFVKLEVPQHSEDFDA